ncbi:MAG: patatin-like phospholipase family protein [Chloroflexi bacterium]|nr:patatin-like phospholipase family protein [Chloroflexota bacterium]
MPHDDWPEYSSADFIKDDLRCCDLVMKGGITSGVVYPPAIIELATRYRFVNIGGTSAGAIAAAAAAAAEYGRAISYAGYSSGFQRLDRLRVWLGERDGNLPGLFQPTGRVRPLFYVLLDLVIAARTAPHHPAKRAPAAAMRLPFAVMRFGWQVIVTGVRGAGVVMRHHGRLVSGVGGAVALVIAAIWLLPSLLNAELPGAAIVAFRLALAILAGLLAGVLVGIANLVWLATSALPRSFFGMCSGHASDTLPTGWPPTLGDESGNGRPPALTDWLHAVVNGLAGRTAHEPPLTFGELAEARAGDQGVRLRMMTSNLTEHMPYVLPKDLGRFLFDPVEFARLFPAPVMDHLRACSAGAAYHVAGVTGTSRTLLPLPVWRDLPVVVGARLSLSFPLLIAAIPLYTLSVAGQREIGAGRVVRAEYVQRHLFSDGGIASNFPIHFFDRWLPTHPTFGINLVQLAATDADDEHLLRTLLSEGVEGMPGAAPQPEMVVKQACLGRTDFNASAPARLPVRAGAAFSDPQGEVYLPPAGPGEDYIEWKDIASVPAFLWAIFGTAQNYRDTAQARLPSYYERIVRVRLKPDEGGLNLRMPRHIVAAIGRKGRLAGRALLPREPEAAGRRRGGFSFDEHRWVRLVVLLSELDQQLRDMRAAYDDEQADYPGFLRAAMADDTLPQCPPYYHGSAAERALFARRIEALIALYTRWSDLDEQTTARLNDMLLRLNRSALEDLARLIDQPDDQAALEGLRHWIGAMHAEKVRAAKGAERERGAVEDMIDLRVTPTI